MESCCFCGIKCYFLLFDSIFRGLTVFVELILFVFYSVFRYLQTRPHSFIHIIVVAPAQTFPAEIPAAKPAVTG